MLRQEDYLMIAKMRRQGAHMIDIAAKLGCHPRTVSRALKRGGEPSGRRPRARGSKLDAYKPMVDALLAEGVWNARVIWRQLQAAGYDGGYTIVTDYIRPKRALQPSRATVRFETRPGRQLQHDWGELDVDIAGETVRAHIAVNVLGYSRRMHVYAAPCQDAEHTYESLIRAFEYFGGVAGEVLVDNQAAAVDTRRDGRAVFNRRFVDLAERYGFTPRACRPYRARTKGKTERMVRYVKAHFFTRYRWFDSWQALNRQLEQWLASEADQRRHGTHDEIVRERFDRDEAGQLGPLPNVRFDTAYIEHRQVGWDGYVAVHGNRYSVPDALCGHTARVRITLDGQLQVLDLTDTVVAEHVLVDPNAGWQYQPSHHRRLWAETLDVERRELSVYEEVATCN